MPGLPNATRSQAIDRSAGIACDHYQQRRLVEPGLVMTTPRVTGYGASMIFTPLHQAIGAAPGPITSDMLDELIAQGIEESDDVDFKREIPPEKALAQSDVVKDIAGFANSGGGALVFGMTEESRRATARVDVGEVTEAYERTLRKVAVSGIHPPVFGLEVSRVGEEGERALVVVVPASIDLPHLIYRHDYFGAPVRYHADTIWMRERQLEQMYRARFEARSRVSQTIDDLYDETAAGRSTNERAWLVAVAAPRLPRIGPRPEQETVAAAVKAAASLSWSIMQNSWIHPFESVDQLNPRRGMRRWVLRDRTSERMKWCEAWMAMLDDGTVTLAMAVGGYLDPHNQNQQVAGSEVYGKTVEACVLELLLLVHEASAALGTSGEYDVKLGIEWTGAEPLLITTFDRHGFRYTDNAVPLGRYTPLRTGIDARAGGDDLQRQMHGVALDAVNQGGVQNLQIIFDPDLR
jgi:hypothetical protein